MILKRLYIKVIIYSKKLLISGWLILDKNYYYIIVKIYVSEKDEKIFNKNRP